MTEKMADLQHTLGHLDCPACNAIRESITFGGEIQSLTAVFRGRPGVA